jgi:aldose 1-epimerase
MPPTRARPPSGNQFLLASGGYQAVVVEVGAGLRYPRWGERDLVEPYAPDELCPAAHGAVLAPWPNRIAEGVYCFDGTRYQLPLNEPERPAAIHGLVRWQVFRPTWVAEDGIELSTLLAPSPGYPFWLEARVTYDLGPEGLVVTTALTNLGDRPAPAALGHHPYLSPGAGATVDQVTLTLAAEHGLRNGAMTSPPDWARGAPSALVGVVADDTLVPCLEGQSWEVRVTGPDGMTVVLEAALPYRFAQVFTGDTLPPGRRRKGLAVEPMTAPPQAFATGDHVAVLEPGKSLAATFRVSIQTEKARRPDDDRNRP